MSLVEEEYHRYFTATGQEGKSLRDARTELRVAQERLAAAAAALQRQEQTAQALASNRLELADLEGRRAAAQKEAQAARDRAEAAQAAGRLVATAQGALNTNIQKVASAREALSVRQQADTTVARLTNELARLERDLAQQSTLQHELERSVERRSGSLSKPESVPRRRAWRSKISNVNGGAPIWSTHRRTWARGSRDWRSWMAAIAAARASRAGLPLIDAASLARLQQLEQVSRATSAKLQGAAVNVVVHLRQDAVIDGIPRAPGKRSRYPLSRIGASVLASWRISRYAPVAESWSDCERSRPRRLGIGVRVAVRGRRESGPGHCHSR